MRKITVCNHVTMDGYFASIDGDISWAGKESGDEEFNAFVAANASQGGTLLFGRTTYQMMESYWPTPFAIERDPVVAARMNAMPKVVFSTTLDKAAWNNTTLAKGDIGNAVRAMKEAPGKDMAILGSGTIVSQLARLGLIDEFTLLVNPLVLGAGKSMFDGVGEKLDMRLTHTRRFANGIMLLSYEAAK